MEKETSFAHLQTVRDTVSVYGLPLSYYVDEHSIFRFVERRGVHVTYNLGKDEGKVQFKRALEQLVVSRFVCTFT